MAAEQSHTLSVGLPLRLPESGWPRVSPITITKNESQEYVISRPNRSTLPGRSESVSGGIIISPDANSTYSDSAACRNSTIVDAAAVYQSSVPGGSFVPSASSSASYQSNGNGSALVADQASSRSNQAVSSCPPLAKMSARVLQRITPNNITTNLTNRPTTSNSSVNSHNTYSPYSHASSTSSDGHNCPLARPKDVASVHLNFASCSSSNVPNVANYPVASCTSSIATNRTNPTSCTPYPFDVSVSSCNYPASMPSATISAPKPFNHLRNLPASAQRCPNRRSLSDARIASDSSSIPFVDLTDSQNSGNSLNQWTNTFPLPERLYSFDNTVASSSASSTNVLFSSQITSTVSERAANAPTTVVDPSLDDCKLSSSSRSRITNLLSEVFLLLRNARLSIFMSDQKQREEDNDKNFDYGMELHRFNAHFSKYSLSNEQLPMVRKLLSGCKLYYQKYSALQLRKENLGLRDEILINNMKLFLINLVQFSSSDRCKSLIAAARPQQKVLSPTPTAALYSSAGTDGSCNSQKYEQQMEWQKAQIKYLEIKLKEKNGIEKELEESKKKCVELEEKLKKKDAVGCWRQDNITEWCCELMSELKTTILDLLENEFKCCICDELLIEPGVTNCQHIFCTVCLNTWRMKKKEKECPVCRANITNVYKVNAIDEFITAATSSISDKAYAERLQVIEDRKNSNPPPAKKPSISVGTTLTNIPLPPVPPSNITLPPPNVPTAMIANNMLRNPPPAHSSAHWSSSQQQQSSMIWQPPTEMYVNAPSMSSSLNRQPTTSWNYNGRSMMAPSRSSYPFVHPILASASEPPESPPTSP